MNNIKVYKSKSKKKHNKSHCNKANDCISNSPKCTIKDYTSTICLSSSTSTIDKSKDNNEECQLSMTKQSIEELTECKIEQILIEIYNHYIFCHCEDIKCNYILQYKNEMRALAQTYEDKCNIFIMKTLLNKITLLIQRYKDKIYDIIETTKIKETLIKHRPRTPDYYITKEYSQKYSIKRTNKNQCLRLNSYTKNVYCYEHCNKKAIRTIVSELLNIKTVLIKASNDIEEVFEYAKREFSEFSIEKCQMEEYSNIILKDSLINRLINNSYNNSNSTCEIRPLIEEIIKDRRLQINEMSSFIYALDHYKTKNKDKDTKCPSLLNCFKSCPSLKDKETEKEKCKEKQKEECFDKSNLCFEDLFKFITGGDDCESKCTVNAKSKKCKNKNKKKKKESKECCPIEQIYCDVVESFKSYLNKASINSSKCQKIKSTISDDWINNLQCQYINNNNSNTSKCNNDNLDHCSSNNNNNINN